MKTILYILLLLGSLSAQAETAYLAGGCFWGMEELIRAHKGVTKTEVGYTGGQTPNAVYSLVKTGTTGHAESIKVDFDSKQLSYEELLLFFFKIHDPTTKNQQGNDIGTQYRSAIFYVNDSQRAAAEKVFTRVEGSKAWKKPLTTEIKPFTKWFKAEDYHQAYLQKNPGGYTCHSIRDLKF